MIDVTEWDDGIMTGDRTNWASLFTSPRFVVRPSCDATLSALASDTGDFMSTRSNSLDRIPAFPLMRRSAILMVSLV